MSYHKILQFPKATIFAFKIIQSLWYLTGIEVGVCEIGKRYYTLHYQYSGVQYFKAVYAIIAYMYRGWLLKSLNLITAPEKYSQTVIW